VKQTETFATVRWHFSNRDGSYTLVALLPSAAQIAPVYGILAGDFDHEWKTGSPAGGKLQRACSRKSAA